MSAPFIALTFHNRPIVKGEFRDKQAALQWANQSGENWPGSRIVQRTKRGLRTIWRAPSEASPQLVRAA